MTEDCPDTDQLLRQVREGKPEAFEQLFAVRSDSPLFKDSVDTGIFYAQAIYIFGQLTGHTPYFGTSGTRKTLGNTVNSMNQYHIIATDMRNFIVLGDPAVRLPRSSRS